MGHRAGVGAVVARGTHRTRSLGSSAPQLEPGSGNLVVEEDTAGVAVQSTPSVKQADRTRKHHRGWKLNLCLLGLQSHLNNTVPKASNKRTTSRCCFDCTWNVVLTKYWLFQLPVLYHAERHYEIPQVWFFILRQKNNTATREHTSTFVTLLPVIVWMWRILES